MKIFLACLLSLFVSQAICAQDISEILFGEGSKLDYIGQYNYNGKRKNGFGIERQKNGALYVGDFSEDNISGRGMLISNIKGISNVPRAVVYVGGWYEGKKSGKGTCYDADGTIVYKGRFEKDKPAGECVETQASANNFAMVNWDGDLYLGEVADGSPEGFGLTVKDDGCVIYCNTHAGIRQGIGMVVYSPEIWDVGKWTDGVFKTIENSQLANSNLAEFRAANKAANKEIRRQLLGAASNFAQAGLAVAEITNGANKEESMGTTTTSATDSYSSSSSSSTKKSSGSKVCTTCAGTGHCHAKSGVANKSYCGGSGTCMNCGGRGYDYAGDGTPIKCTWCNGKGKCKWCKGTGKCKTCGGTGKA